MSIIWDKIEQMTIFYTIEFFLHIMSSKLEEIIASQAKVKKKINIFFLPYNT